jgi:CRISPR-associated endonuclease Csn1
MTTSARQEAGSQSAHAPFVLGLDIGTNSVGWALLRLDAGGVATSIERLGVRIFDTGLENFGTSKEASRASGRRLARGMRRQTARRRQRKSKTLGLLIAAGLMPSIDRRRPENVRLALDAIDRELHARHAPKRDDLAHQTLLYRLRARGVHERLGQMELGRVLYHLAQRRGFKSNRRVDGRGKKAADAADESSVVKAGIQSLREEMRAGGHATLGAYFATLDPHVRRIRSRYTSREDYEREFDLLRAMQEPLHPDLPTGFWAGIRAALFDQRPLKSSSHLIGRCDLEERRPRAPLYSDLAQRARILQDVNHLRVSIGSEPERPLTPDERGTLLSALLVGDRLTWPQAAKALGLKKPKVAVQFNLQRGGADNLKGHATAARVRPIVGTDRWDAWTSVERDRVAQWLDSVESPVVLRRLAKEMLELDEEAAEQFANSSVPEGHARHSTRAYRRLLPYLEQGLSYAEAADRAYPDRRRTTEVHSTLPPLVDAFPDLRNPTVARSLTEVRKVVNELIATYGRPERIHVELARDVKRGRKAREEISRKINANRKQREKARAKILAERPNARPSSGDVQKVLLAEECHWICPYTGRSFGMDDLFGDHPTIDVEHIVPFSRCFDDSFANKTLCYVEENRTVKRNQTPFEAYGSDQKRFKEILERVARFDTAYAPRRAKLERFAARDDGEWDLDEFVSRQLVDTAYAARMATEYLGCLYGGRVDADGQRRVQPTNGRVTSYLRRQWGSETLLGKKPDGGSKSREDHRHHALDAAVVALSTPSAVKQLSDAAEKAEARGHTRPFIDIPPPWPGFRSDLERALRPIVVSHRVQRKLNGRLHEETNYQSRKDDEKGWTRKPVSALKDKDLEHIIDPVFRDALMRWIEAGRPDPGPRMRSRDGREQTVRHVRLRGSRGAVPIGEGDRRRYVAPGSNHHMEIVRRLDGKGGYEAFVVTRLEAMERQRLGKPVVRRDFGSERAFMFSLHPGDALARPYGPGWEVLVVSSISDGVVECRFAADARSATDIRKGGAEGGRLAGAPSGFLKQGYIKVDVSAAGRITRSHE